MTLPPAAGADPPQDRAPWPFPFADGRDGRLGRRAWAGLAVAFLVIHFLALGVANRTGNLDFAPNHDHARVMPEILAQGYPTLAMWPPGNGYYIGEHADRVSGATPAPRRGPSV